MSYKIEIDAYSYDIKGSFFTNTYNEKISTIQNDEFSMNLKDVYSSNFHLIWGNYSSGREKEMTLKFETPSVVSHFGLSSISNTQGARSNAGVAKYSKTYHQKANSYIHEVAAADHEYSFFELLLSNSFFEKFVTEDSKFLMDLYENAGKEVSSGVSFDGVVTTEMLSHIVDMSNTNYSGSLKALYLEAKVIELFLLQIKQTDQKRTLSASKLKPADIDSLQDAKKYIEEHYATPCSIIDLAKIVGINQMKLKSGFKELFGTTVFGYLRDLQMSKAKQLLLEENLFVGEVADLIGYKHPHHFSLAFKRKFGILPSELKK